MLMGNPKGFFYYALPIMHYALPIMHHPTLIICTDVSRHVSNKNYALRIPPKQTAIKYIPPSVEKRNLFTYPENRFEMSQ